MSELWLSLSNIVSTLASYMFVGKPLMKEVPLRVKLHLSFAQIANIRLWFCMLVIGYFLLLVGILLFLYMVRIVIGISVGWD